MATLFFPPLGTIRQNKLYHLHGYNARTAVSNAYHEFYSSYLWGITKISSTSIGETGDIRQRGAKWNKRARD